jgi:hypothetical protein
MSTKPQPSEKSMKSQQKISTKKANRHGASPLLLLAAAICIGTRFANADEPAKLIKKPEIVVEQPAGQNLKDGKSKRGFNMVPVGGVSKSKAITIRNVGTGPLRGLFVTLAGKNPNDFTIGPLFSSKLKSGGTAIFKVQFKPTAKGKRNAIIRIRSNDANEDPFDIMVSGTGS